MSFILKNGFDEATPLYCGTSSTVVVNQVVTFDRSNGIVIPATASLLCEDLAGVAQNTPASADTTVNVIPFTGDQEWEWDCTSNTATNQLNKRSILTDGVTVANTSTDQAVDEITVTPYANVGAASDKKQRGAVVLVPATLS